MKIVFHKILLILFTFGFLFSSCRKEKIESIQGPEEETLIADSDVSRLIENVALHDGSIDNILNNANCFTIKWPATVTVNMIQVEVNSLNDLNTVEAILDIDDEDTDVLNISFPITIIKEDFSEIVVTTNTELNTIASACNGENIADQDIECIDFEYPINASRFNTVSEVISTENLTSDKALFTFINSLTTSDVVTIDFPLTARLSDDSQVSINNLIDLETIIMSTQNDCDEDDDYDYSDDDCNTCTIAQLESILTNECSNWYVRDLTRNDTNLDYLYNGYVFNFFNDHTISVSWAMTTVYGTWSATGSGNSITVIVNIPALIQCNNNWILHEIQEYNGEQKVDFTLGNERLRYISTCN